MGVFDDQKLEKLDWMTQMTETIESDLNALLARLPDRVSITAKDIIGNDASSYMSLSVRNVMDKRIQALISGSLSYEEEQLLADCFDFELKGEPEFNLRTNNLSCEIAVVKTKHTFSDEELQPLMGRRGLDAIGNVRSYGTPDAPLDRMNEILDILGNCKDAMKTKSGKKKAIAIKDRLAKIFRDNEWRIRDMNLANKVGFWIKGYIRDGNLADLTNLCKLKVMTHNNMPIYSVKEEV